MKISLGKTQKGKKNQRRIEHGGFLSTWHLFVKVDIETRNREPHFELWIAIYRCDKNVGQHNNHGKFFNNNEKVVKTNTMWGS